MNKTPIEWTDYTWNPVSGCHKVSAGCKFCYAETLTNRFAKHWGMESFRDVQIRPERLSEPFMMHEQIRGKKVFVCDMSDLFHEAVPFSFIMQVYHQFALCPDTIFQVLTKRVERALEFYYWAGDLLANINNVWFGVSVEDQKASDKRIPVLLQIRETVRFLSCEPLIGPIDLSKIKMPDWCSNREINCLSTESWGYHHTQIHWVIAGGESGNKNSVRPMHPDWARSLRDQCKAAGVPFFFKQWGQYRPFEATANAPFYRDCATGEEHDGHVMNFIDYDHPSEAGLFLGYRWYPPMDAITLCLDNENDSSCLNEENDCSFLKMGKSKSGNLLDGKQHLEFPE